MSKPLKYYVFQFNDCGALIATEGFNEIEDARKFLAELVALAEPGDVFSVSEID